MVEIGAVVRRVSSPGLQFRAEAEGPDVITEAKAVEMAEMDAKEIGTQSLQQGVVQAVLDVAAAMAGALKVEVVMAVPMVGVVVEMVISVIAIMAVIITLEDLIEVLEEGLV